MNENTNPYRLSVQVREKVGPEGHVIGAVSGGVDSSVAAVLLQKAIGECVCSLWNILVHVS